MDRPRRRLPGSWTGLGRAPRRLAHRRRLRRLRYGGVARFGVDKKTEQTIKWVWGVVVLLLGLLCALQVLGAEADDPDRSDVVRGPYLHAERTQTTTARRPHFVGPARIPGAALSDDNVGIEEPVTRTWKPICSRLLDTSHRTSARSRVSSSLRKETATTSTR